MYSRAIQCTYSAIFEQNRVKVVTYICLRVATPTHVARRRKTLQMHGFQELMASLYKHMGNTPGGMVLIPKCESKIETSHPILHAHKKLWPKSFSKMPMFRLITFSKCLLTYPKKL